MVNARAAANKVKAGVDGVVGSSVDTGDSGSVVVIGVISPS